MTRCGYCNSDLLDEDVANADEYQPKYFATLKPHTCLTCADHAFHCEGCDQVRHVSVRTEGGCCDDCAHHTGVAMTTPGVL